jgi:hypothetical protein
VAFPFLISSSPSDMSFNIPKALRIFS